VVLQIASFFLAGFIHWVLNSLHFTIHIREVCVFLAPLFSGLAAVATFLLTSELKDEGAGLLAAAFIGIGMLCITVSLQRLGHCSDEVIEVVNFFKHESLTCGGTLTYLPWYAAPGYISRSVAGSYDNEGIAIFALVITYYFWIKVCNWSLPAMYYLCSILGSCDALLLMTQYAAPS
jgi:dolichyl-diphosphooligosaccharide--protein glycosyltransferase